jgi:hypothetical protein
LSEPVGARQSPLRRNLAVSEGLVRQGEIRGLRGVGRREVARLPTVGNSDYLRRTTARPEYLRPLFAANEPRFTGNRPATSGGLQIPPTRLARSITARIRPSRRSSPRDSRSTRGRRLATRIPTVSRSGTRLR